MNALFSRLQQALTRHINVNTSLQTEWGWVLGRIAVLAVVGLGTSLFLGDTPARNPIFIVLCLALLYNFLIAYLLTKKRLLTAIKIAVDLLPDWEAAEANRQRARALRALQNGVERLERIVQQSLNYSQLEGSHLSAPLVQAEPVGLEHAFTEAANWLQPLIATKEQQLTLAIPANVPLVLINLFDLDVIVSNLISNATKFALKVGAIRVEAHIELPFIRVDMMNNGPRIPEDEANALSHESYRRTADAGTEPGTSMGLAITRWLVESYGGAIKVKTSLEWPAVFSFTLPAAPLHEGAKDQV